MAASSGERLTFWRFVRELVAKIRRDKLTDIAAQLAYNSLLAMFPFFIFLVTIVGFLPVRGVTDQILATLSAVMPAGTMPLLQQAVDSVVRSQNGSLLAISIAGSMWVASGGIASFTSALNAAFDVRETRGWVRVRLQSLAITVFATVLLIVATTALLVGPQLVEDASAFFGIGVQVAVVWVWALLRWPATILAMSVLLAILYWACPNVRHRFRLITVGSVVAVPAWIGVSMLFNLYVSHLGRFNKTYGALGTGVVLIIWIYLSGFIVLVGGEMNALLETRRQRKIERARAAADPEMAAAGPGHNEATERDGAPA